MGTSARTRRTPVIRALAALFALALVAAACGSSDDDATTDTTVEETTEETTETTQQGAATTTTTEATEEPAEIVEGGTLTYAIEAESAQAWRPYLVQCAISCYMVLNSVMDPAMYYNADGDIGGYLLESAEPNDDYTVWTLTARDGITFHDGEPFDGAAIADNLQRQTTSILTGQVLQQVESVEVDPSDPMSAVVTMSAPWTNFPVLLVGQIGYMGSPAWYAAADEDPTVQTQPVGTGPFVYQSYSPNASFTATKNDDYWRDGFPYLDSVEFRPIQDGDARSNALESGQVDVIHTSAPDQIARWRAAVETNPNITMTEADDFGETGYIMFNVDRPDSILSDVRVRQALAYAFDAETYNDIANSNIPRIANGPFSPSQVGYLEDSGFPEYDMEQAQALFDEYLADTGQSAVTVTFNTTADATNLRNNQIIASMWEQLDGLTVQINQIAQDQYITEALLGNFEAFAWRNHAGVDPDSQNVWWTSATAQPLGTLAINFGRFRDDVIDESLTTIRQSDDQAERQAAAEAINRRFAEQVYNLWTQWTIWGIVYDTDVNGLFDTTMPDGDPTLPVLGGRHFVTATWIG